MIARKLAGGICPAIPIACNNQLSEGKKWFIRFDFTGKQPCEDRQVAIKSRLMPDKVPLYQRIYAVVRQIPPGKVASYGQIARIVGGCSAHMVGFAMAGSGAHTDVPWQRVINVQGKVSPRIGFGGLLQRELLEEEGGEFDGEGRVDFERFGWLGN